MLQLPGDDFVTIELVYDPAKSGAGPGAGINHLVVQVESLDVEAGWQSDGPWANETLDCGAFGWT
jgi:hypothetical protein